MDVKQISIHRYTLTPLSTPNRLSQKTPRQGALLKVEFNNLPEAGFADLFPWPELGDEALEEQIKSLKECPYRQAAASLSWAHYEARAKSRGIALLSDVSVHNHKTMTELTEIEPFYTHAKIKISSLISFQEAMTFIKDKKQTFRLDFNGLLTSFDEAEKYKTETTFDFIEDPFSAALMQDKKAPHVFKSPLALDRDENPLKKKVCDVWVIKPVYYAPDYLFEEMAKFKKRIVITSNMDHPLGQIIAMHVAQKYPQETHGLLTQDLYSPHAQSDWVKQTQSILTPSFKGFGWGLDPQLSALSWEKLC